MAAQLVLTNLEHYAQQLSARVKALPVSFWRTLIIVIALVWVCHSAARLFWLLFPAPALDTPTNVAVAPAPEVGSLMSYAVDLAALQQRELFGKAQVIPEASVQQVVEPEIGANVAKTTLNLELVGVMVSSDPRLSTATISQGANQQIYQLGEKLPAGNNVTLAKILYDRVILDNNGNYEALWLYTEADFALKTSYAPAQPAYTQQYTEPRTASPEFEAKIRPDQIPEKISDVVRFSVHREEGQMVGFRIRPGRNRELFDQIGLQANDVVTSVNGIPIDNAQAIRDNYQQLKNATTADLEVKRGEETLYINVSLDTTSE